MVPRAVLMKSGLVLVNIARQVNAAHSKPTVNVARSMSHIFKIAHSSVKKPIYKNKAFKNSNVNQRMRLSIKMRDRLVRAATTASSLEAEQDSGGGPRCQETIGDTIAQTRVEFSGDEESLGEDPSKQERRINAIDADEEITLVSAVDNDIFDVDVLGGDEVFVAGQNENVIEEVVDAAQVSTAASTVIITTKEITLAQALEALKTSKPKVKGIIFQEPCKSTTTTKISLLQSQDKVKVIMIEEPVKPKKKDQIRLDEEAAKKLQAKFDEEERLAREKAEKKEQESNIALIEE
uniref:Uncharacterized protein n=1 Tax=Tanacetum cinerariifolium TaxID=118510 RepID=A0A6L2JP65_TANCI|nr:hypothetical protein [Tanacetum cinerariifolium]